MPDLTTLAENPITLPGRNFSGISLWNVSETSRYGCKGANAAAWLGGLGFPIPDAPNRWRVLSEGGLIARLGRSEFLLEAPGATLPAPPAGVAPVLRQDAAIVLGGEKALTLLKQVCNVNFAAATIHDAVTTTAGPVVLTSMAGVSVTVILKMADANDVAVRQGAPEGLHYHLLYDGAYGDYLWKTLHDVAADL
ncbi:MAG: hypothetical protein LBU11_00595 [Zoogloeaceae bacterium]|jgi:sarcosine oxidase subunit gamma|nr:hypothetical protein [Zoogloeaceae bacterium]